jgi:DNA-binding GntR family transcriptional regulator
MPARTSKSRAKPIERRTLTSSVYERLLDEICSGQVKPGERLVIDQIARDLRVSITPVREALMRLQSEGLVSETMYSGMRVAELSMEDIVQHHEIRGVLAGYAASLAAARISDEQIQSLETTFEKLERAAKDGDVKAFRQLDRAFHEQLYSAAGSHMAIEQFNQLSRHTERYWLMGRAFLDRSYLESSQSDHREIMRLLKARNGRDLEMVIRRHALNFATHLARVLRNPHH